jgi:hypothetical protein
VWNVYAQSNEADQVAKELKNTYNTADLRQFFTWKEYQSLQQKQQTTILHLHNTFSTEFRSLLIHGFSKEDTGTNVMWDDDIEIHQTIDAEGLPTGKWECYEDTEDNLMSYESIDDRFHNHTNLKTTNISDYIQQAFHSGDKTPVFAHVYAPILGAREVLVPSHHIPEALDLINIVKTDICRKMNHRAIIKNFPDHDDLILSTTVNDTWQPFDIQLTITEIDHLHSHQNKRMRLPKTSWQPKNRSYAEVTNANRRNSYICDNIHTLPTHSTTSTITSISHNADTIITSDKQSNQTTETNQENICTLLQELQTIHDNLCNLSSTVETNRQHHLHDIKQLETRFEAKIQTDA